MWLNLAGESLTMACAPQAARLGLPVATKRNARTATANMRLGDDDVRAPANQQFLALLHLTRVTEFGEGQEFIMGITELERGPVFTI